MSNLLLDNITKHELLTIKYTPTTFEQLILQPITKKKLNNLLKNPENSIFIGSSGSGKTVTARILGRKIIPKEFAKNIFLNLNASDDRGLNLINNIIIPFIKKKFDKFPFKLIIINEANTITPKAQVQISYLMETYSNCKWIFVSSELNDISDTIQSRCSILFFPLLSSDDILVKLNEINIKEKINLTDECLNTLISITQRDLRQAINFLQVVSYIKEKTITPELIYLLFDKPNIVMIKNILISLKNKNKIDTLNIINKVKNKGYSPNDILLAILNYILEFKPKDFDEVLTKDFMLNVYKITSKYYIRINQGTETWIQVYGCLSEIFLL